MTNQPNLAPISEAALAERWFSLRNKTWRLVAAAVKASGVDQNKLANRIGMDAGQFNRAVTGKNGNVTLRTLHNIARAVNHRLQISLVPLSDLPQPNYSYEDGGHDRQIRIDQTTDTPIGEDWTRETKTLGRALEPA